MTKEPTPSIRVLHVAINETEQTINQMQNEPNPYDEGYRAGERNLPQMANPYPRGSEAEEDWAMGHAAAALDQQIADAENILEAHAYV